MISVFSENPENDLWRELLQFSYEANINRYLSKKGLHANGETINCIVGSFLQADEYYRAAKDANLQISPLLLYYGTTNLNFASEFGETAKYSFVTVDSEMIHIHPLVKEILRVGLPMVKEAH